MLNLSKYKNIIFDCDGVILNSNHIKTQAFYKSALLYGEKAAGALKEYHVLHGGISRHEKFSYFLNSIVQSKDNIDIKKNELLQQFSKEVKSGLLHCEMTQSLPVFRKMSAKAKWFVVSGGDQSELREVFHKRKIDKFFDGGIYGSPKNKHEIMLQLYDNFSLCGPTLFIGDSRYDYLTANEFECEFVFISGWSEVKDWEKFCKSNKLYFVASLSDLVL